MASVTKPPTPSFLHRNSNPTSLCSSPLILSFPFYRTTSFRLRVSAPRSNGDKIGSQDSYGNNLLRKPIVSPASRDLSGNSDKEESSEEEEEDDGWIDWDDKILEETVPLVGFARMLIHSGKYESGARLSPEHETTILEKLLPYHPEFEKKIGCGIDYITIGYHPEFEGSRCLFVVRKDGELVDFSFWKCIKGLIRKNYPLYADSFILRHFRRHRRSG